MSTQAKKNGGFKRIKLPKQLVRYRIVLPAAAIFSWLIAFIIHALLKWSPSLSLVPVIAIGAIIFVWTIGLFCLIETCYPLIQVKPGEFISRAERYSPLKYGYMQSFFAGYAVGALLGTVACLRVAVSG